MPHLVKYTKTDGQSGDYEVEDLHDAVAHVERLRNEEGIEGARIFRIEEVRFEYRPYFRVEVGDVAAPATAPVRPSFTTVNDMPATPIWAPPAEAPAPADDEPEKEPAAITAATDAGPEPAPLADPWADAPPPPAAAEGEHAVPNGRRGLFGR